MGGAKLAPSLSPGTTATQVKVTAVLTEQIISQASPDPPPFLRLPIGSTNQHFKQETHDDPSQSYINILSISISILTLGSKYIGETKRKLYLVFNNTASTYLAN